MNELQIKLTGDISALQSALTKAKATIKSFEESTTKESERGNVGFKRKIGLIESLTNKSKALRTALSQATNENDVARYNQELEQTIKEMTRLNALGRQVQNNIGATSQGFKGAAKNIGSANGVAIEFNRIIQDAPFGLIGIGNNLQQLTANFAQTSKAAGGAGAAIKASLGALISPANLLVLGISAITAAFTAYQMGAFDFLKSNEASAKSVKELAEELKSATANAAVEQIKINSLREVIEDETMARDERYKAVKRLQDSYPTIFGNADREKLLNGQLIGSYDLLTKAIVQRANASLAETEIPNLVKQKEVIDSQVRSLEKQLETEQKLLGTRSKFVPFGSLFSDFNIAEAEITDLFSKLSELNVKQRGLQINIDGYAEAIVSYTQEFEPLLGNPIESVETLKRTFDTLPEFINTALSRINLEKLDFFSQQFEAPLASRESGKQETQGIIGLSPGIPDEEKEKILETNSILADSFASLGLGIASSMNIGNDSLKGFIMTLISSTPKIIAAMRQASAAKSAAATKDIATNTKVATSEGVSVATKAANALGPVGMALLPVFIGGVLALISSGMKGGGGGGGGFAGGGGASAGKAPQIFTNKVSPPSSSSPNFNSGSIDQANAQSRLFVDVSGDNLRFILDRANERANNG